MAAIPLVHDADTYVPEEAALRRCGIAETNPLAFHTPYGCSKGAADQYVLDYAHSFGLRTAAMRMSCIYGPHQMGTEDQGWVAHFVKSALREEPIAIFGDGHQVRDVLHVDDAVDAYLAAWDAIDTVSGKAFNLGGGPANAISLLQLVAHIEQLLDRPVETTFHDWRAGDQRYYVSDRTRIDAQLHLPPARPWRSGVGDLVEWFREWSPLSKAIETIVPAEAV